MPIVSELHRWRQRGEHAPQLKHWRCTCYFLSCVIALLMLVLSMLYRRLQTSPAPGKHEAAKTDCSALPESSRATEAVPLVCSYPSGLKALDECTSEIGKQCFAATDHATVSYKPPSISVPNSQLQEQREPELRCVSTHRGDSRHMRVTSSI